MPADLPADLSAKDFTIRPLGIADRAAFRALRQRALTTDPYSFLMTRAEEDAVPRLMLENLLEQPDPANCLLGAERGQDLLGILGLANRKLIKINHVSHIVSVYVAPEARGRGIARALLAAAIERAFACAHIGAINLDVVAGQQAERLYRGAGFVEFGREPDAHRLAGKNFDLILMRLARPMPSAS